MKFLLVAGTTRTATIDGISAAGSDPVRMAHTPSADAEILVFGRPVRSPVVPVSPTGCPTPAVLTRAVFELVGVPVTVVDGGLAEPTAVDPVSVCASPGADVREPEPVSNAAAVFEAARTYGRLLPDDEHLFLAESVPGGTTTALGTLTALGEQATVSSSLPDNPIARKRTVVETGLAASGLSAGGASGDPTTAVRLMGDPVLAVAAGIARGAIETGTSLTLAGGTQLLAVAALLRHDGLEESLDLATTSFLLADDSADVEGLAGALDVDVEVTDPGFERTDHPAARAYCDGEAKEGAGMGGALAIAAASDRSMASVRRRFVSIADRLATLEDRPPASRETD